MHSNNSGIDNKTIQKEGVLPAKRCSVCQLSSMWLSGQKQDGGLSL